MQQNLPRVFPLLLTLVEERVGEAGTYMGNTLGMDMDNIRIVSLGVERYGGRRIPTLEKLALPALKATMRVALI